MTNTITGIPIELMFGALGGLICIIYGNIVAELRALRKSGARRDNVLTLICDKLKISFTPGD